MIKKLFLLIIYLLLLNGCTADQKNEEGDSPRIISLSPHLTEILFELKAGDDLVAVTDFCTFPVQAQNLEKIGGLLNPNIEKMVALKPTHVFGVPAHADLAATLKNFHIELIMMTNETISDYIGTVIKIGRLIGRETEAHKLTTSFTDSLNSLSSSARKDSLSAVLVIGLVEEGLRNITVAGTTTFISELWEKIGGINIYDDLPTHYASISLESLLLRDPSIIIELSSAEPAEIIQLNSAEVWYDLETLQAVRMKHIYIISGSHTLIPGPRMLKLAHDFSELIKKVYNEKRLYSDIHW